MKKNNIRSYCVIALILFFVISFTLILTHTALADVTYKLQVPLPDFPSNTIDLCTGTDSIACSGIAQYIKFVFEWLIRLAIVLGVGAFTIAGLLWLTARGDTKQIDTARSVIQNTTFGVVLALSAYTILWTLNPSLVTFDVLNLGKNIKGESLITEFPDIEDPAASATSTPGISTPGTAISNPLRSGRTHCDDPAGNGLAAMPDMPGIAYGPVERFFVAQGVESLKKVGARAAAEGYTIHISSACRNYAGQERAYATAPPGMAAKPGGSLHGHGQALDVQLYRGGTRLTPGANSAGQCGLSSDEINYFSKMAGYFYAEGWQRLTFETWHFEYGTSMPCRAQCAGYASLCSGSPKCPSGVGGCSK